MIHLFKMINVCIQIKFYFSIRRIKKVLIINLAKLGVLIEEYIQNSTLVNTTTYLCIYHEIRQKNLN